MRLSQTRLALALGAISAPSAALADVGEVAVRPYGEVRRDAVAGEAVTVWGGGLLLGYGLSFPLTATVRYGFDPAPAVRRERAGGATEWRRQRHALTAGLAWAPSDEWTPVLSLEAGAALRRDDVRDYVRREGGADALLARAVDTAVDPAARASAALEWRFFDFWSLGGGAFAEHVGAFGYGAWLALTAYHYL